MRLLHGTLRPGRVIEIIDNHGNIKVEAPGLFSREDIEVLPPVMPFFGGHANTYSSLDLYDEVWILNMTDNPQQLFWFRKDTARSINKEIESTGENVEILCNRVAGTGYASIYFTDGTGWIIRNSESNIQIRPDGSILLDSNGMPSRSIHICPNSISLGTEGGSAHPAAYADELQKVLESIVACLYTIRQAASVNAYTNPIANAIGTIPERISSNIPKILSPNVTLD